MLANRIWQGASGGGARIKDLYVIGYDNSGTNVAVKRLNPSTLAVEWSVTLGAGGTWIPRYRPFVSKKSGNLYYIRNGDFKIVKITPTGVVTVSANSVIDAVTNGYMYLEDKNYLIVGGNGTSYLHDLTTGTLIKSVNNGFNGGIIAQQVDIACEILYGIGLYTPDGNNYSQAQNYINISDFTTRYSSGYYFYIGQDGVQSDEDVLWIQSGRVYKSHIGGSTYSQIISDTETVAMFGTGYLLSTVQGQVGALIPKVKDGYIIPTINTTAKTVKVGKINLSNAKVFDAGVVSGASTTAPTISGLYADDEASYISTVVYDGTNYRQKATKISTDGVSKIESIEFLSVMPFCFFVCNSPSI